MPDILISSISGKILLSVPGDDLISANLCGADLYGANLYGAKLCEANLYGANLCGANLCGANLCGANLQSSYLHNANLYHANLLDANLFNADLRGANLRNANLNNTKLPAFQIPEGDLYVWKKTAGGLVKLHIPRKARRTASLVGRKCRCEWAVVKEVIGDPAKAISMYNGRILYVVGETVRPDSYDPDIRVECSHGIHFFLTREEAEDYS